MRASSGRRFDIWVDSRMLPEPLFSGRTCELRLNDIHGTNAEISPDFQMVSRSGQALGPHPYQPLK